MPYEERFERTGFRKVRGDLVERYKILTGIKKIGMEEMFTRPMLIISKLSNRERLDRLGFYSFEEENSEK